MKVVISAAYGMGNLGDEAIFEVLTSDISRSGRGCKMYGLVFDKKLFNSAHVKFLKDHDVAVHGFFFRSKKELLNPWRILDYLFGLYHLATCDLFLLGGGGLVRNKTTNLKLYLTPLFIAQFLKKKNLIIGVGVDKITEGKVVKLLNRIHEPDMIVLRDENSLANLGQVTQFKKVKVIPDPVCHYLGSVNHTREVVVPAEGVADPCLLGLNLTFWKAEYQKGETEAFIAALAEALNHAYLRHPYDLMYLPTVPQKDDGFFLILKSKLDKRIKTVEPKISEVEDFLDHARRCRSIIAMRMHAILLSSNLDKSIIAIAYDEKVEQLKGIMGSDLLQIPDTTKDYRILEEKIVNALQDRSLKYGIWTGLREGSKELAALLEDFMHD